MTGRTGSAGQELARRGAGGDEHAAGRDDLAALELHRVLAHARDAGARAELRPGGRRGGAERGDQPARVDGMVVAELEREPHGRRERGLGAARGRGQEPLGAQAVAGVERGEPLERLRVVAVAGDDERAGRAQLRVDARRGGQLGAEARVRGGGAHAQLEQRLLAVLELGDGREHAGGDVPRAGLAGVEHEHAQAALGRPPRAREADRPAAHDEDVRLALLHRHDHCTPSLRRHDPDQVRRSAPRWRPLQPDRGLP